MDYTTELQSQDFEVIGSTETELVLQRKVLGSGGEAKVRLGTLQVGDGSKKDVAVKIFDKSTSDAPHLMTEASNYSKLPRHKNVLETYYSGTFTNPGAEEKFYIVLKLMGPSLKDVICDEDFRAMCTFRHLVKILLDVAYGLQHVHLNGMVHGDLKPANVLLGEDGTSVLADFSMATCKKAERVSVSRHDLGTEGYYAPEIPLKISTPRGSRQSDANPHISVSEYSDVYSFGKIVRNSLLKVKRLPIKKELCSEDEGSGSDNPELDQWFPHELKKLINECTRFSWKKCCAGESRYGRPSCQQIIESLLRMRSADWYNEVIQDYAQKPKTEDHSFAETMDQDPGCHCHQFILPCYNAVRYSISRTADFLRSRFRKQPSKRADKYHGT